MQVTKSTTTDTQSWHQCKIRRSRRTSKAIGTLEKCTCRLVASSTWKKLDLIEPTYQTPQSARRRVQFHFPERATELLEGRVRVLKYVIRYISEYA